MGTAVRHSEAAGRTNLPAWAVIALTAAAAGTALAAGAALTAAAGASAAPRPAASASGGASMGTTSGHSSAPKQPKTTTTTHPATPRLARSGKIGFWECSSKTTELLVAVNTLTLRPGATLDVSFTMKNGGAASCNYTAPYAGVEPGPTSSSLQAGPCGSIGFEIENSARHKVWPGTQVVNCPALGFARLAPGATVSGTGTWDQTKPNSTARVPAGGYTLVVGNKHFSFPLRVARS
jgi:hypothetical protein